MLESLVSWLVANQLGSLLKEFSSSNLELRIRSGQLLLQDVSLSPAALTAALNLPLAVVEAHIARLEVLLPWRQSPPAPLMVRIEGARIVLGPLESEAGLDRLSAWRREQKLKRVRASGATGRAEAKAQTPASSSSTMEPWQMRALVDALLRDLHVSLSDLSLCYGASTGGPAVSMTLSSLHLRCQRQQAVPRLLALCWAPKSTTALSEHSCDCTLEMTVRADWHPDGLHGAVATEPILEPWGLRSSVSFRIEWPPAHAPTRPPGLHIDGTCTLDRLRITCTATQMAHLLHIIRTSANPTVALAHRAHRPPACASVGSWWRYAISAVCSDLREEQARTSWRWLRARILTIRAYELAYHAELARTAHESDHRSPQQTNALRVTAPTAAAVEAAAGRAAAAAAAADDESVTALGAASRMAPPIFARSSTSAPPNEHEKRIRALPADAAEITSASVPSAALVPGADLEPEPLLLTRQSASFGAQPAAVPTRPASASTRRGMGPPVHAYRSPAVSSVSADSPTAWLEEALDVDTICQCRERVLAKLFTTTKQAGHTRSVSAPPDVSADFSGRSAAGGASRSALELRVALRLKAHGVVMRAYPQLGAVADDKAVPRRAHFEVNFGDIGMDLRHSMSVGGGPAHTALSSELSASLEGVRLVYMQPTHQDAISVTSDAGMNGGGGNGGGAKPPESRWKCTNVLCCSDAAAASPHSNSAVQSSTPFQIRLPPSQPASPMSAASVSLFAAPSAARGVTAPSPLLQITAHLDAPSAPAPLTAGVAVCVARPLTASVDLAICRDVLSLVAAISHPPIVPFTRVPTGAASDAVAATDRAAGLDSGRRGSMSDAAPAARKKPSPPPSSAQLPRPPPQLSLQLDVHAPLLAMLTAAERPELVVPVARLQRVHATCSYGACASADSEADGGGGGGGLSIWAHVCAGLSLAPQARLLGLLVSPPARSAATCGSRASCSSVQSSSPSLVSSTRPSLAAGAIDAMSDADSDDCSVASGTPVAEIVISKDDLEHDEPRSTDASPLNLLGARLMRAFSSPDASSRRSDPPNSHDDDDEQPGLTKVRSVPNAASSEYVSSASSMRSRTGGGALDLRIAALETSLRHANGGSPTPREGDSSPLRRTGSQLNTMLERFHRAASAPTVELAIQLIIGPNYAEEDDVEADCSDDLPTPPTPLHSQLLAGSGELLAPCAFTCSLELPSFLWSTAAAPPTEPLSSAVPFSGVSSAAPHPRQSRALISRQAPSCVLTLQGSLPTIRVHLWTEAAKQAAELGAFGVETARELAGLLQGQLVDMPESKAPLVPSAEPPPPPRFTLSFVSLQLHVPVLEVHVHTQAALAGERADLVLTRISALTLACDMELRELPTIDAATYIREVAVIDSRPHVGADRELVVCIHGGAATPPPLEMRAAIRALTENGASVGWQLPRTSLVAADDPTLPMLVAGLVPPSDAAARVLPLKLTAACTQVSTQWNPLLFGKLVAMGVGLMSLVPPKAVPAAASAAPASPAPPPLRIELDFDASVDEVKSVLNAEDHVGDLEGSSAPPTLTGAPALRKLKSLLDADAHPELLELLVLTTSRVTVVLRMEADTAITMRLDGVLGGVRCPVHSPPALHSFDMVLPLSVHDAAVVVHIKKDETTRNLPDITVEAPPVVFEFRQQVLLQSIDYIDRCIIDAFAPLRGLGKRPPAQPLWRVLVPNARMLMPTNGEGCVEFVLGKASVHNTLDDKPTATQIIHVTAANVTAYITREHFQDDARPVDERLPMPTSPRHRLSPLPLIEQLSSVRLVMRAPLRKVVGAAHGQPFMALTILPFDETVHLGFQPEDMRTMIALGLHNFAVTYFPPPDAAKMALPRTTVAMTISLRVPQAVVWLHSSERTPAVGRLELNDVTLEMSKTLQLVTKVDISVAHVSLHGRWQPHTDGLPHWLQMLGAPVAACAAAAAAHEQREGLENAARVASAPAASPASEASAGNRIDVKLCIGTPAGLPDVIVVDLGRQAFIPTPLPLLALADFGLQAAAAALAIVATIPPSADLQELDLTLRLPLLQLLVPEAQLSPDGLAVSPGGPASSSFDASNVPPPWLLSSEAAAVVRPRVLAMHFGASVQVQKSKDVGGDGSSSALVQQVAVHATHQYTCVSVGHFSAPTARPEGHALGELMTAPTHSDRDGALLAELVVVPSEADAVPCVLEHSVLLLDLTKRPQQPGVHPPSSSSSLSAQQQQLSVQVLEPLCLSVNATQIIMLGALSRQWVLAAKARPIVVPAALTSPAQHAPEHAAALAAAEALGTMSTMASCPFVQLTVLSAEVPALPLLQLSVGDEGAPLSVSVEKHAGSPLLATEMAVVVQVRFYNAPLFAWEPLVESFEVDVSIRSGGKPAVAANLSVPDTLNVNLSDAMLRAAYANLKAGHALYTSEVDSALVYVPLNLQEGIEQTNITLSEVRLHERNGRGEPTLVRRSSRDGNTAPSPLVRRGSRDSGIGTPARRNSRDSGIAGGSLDVSPPKTAEPAAPVTPPAAPLRAVEAAPGAVPSFLTNETGGEIRCWVVHRQTAAASGANADEEASVDVPATAPADAPADDGVADGDVSRVVVLPAGSTKLLPFWDEDPGSLDRDWHEDGPREVCVQLAGDWLPLSGIVVSQPNITVLPLERRESPADVERLAAERAAAAMMAAANGEAFADPPARTPRCVVCEVELHARGTRLTVRSMLTLVNHTRRLLIADLALHGAPLQHLGLLPPGGTLPVPEKGLEGGLRLIDAGGADGVGAASGDSDSGLVASALDAADAREASGKADELMWMPSLMSTQQEARPSAEEEATWRGLFGRPPVEYLLRSTLSCTMGERAGDLYLGSHALHFRASAGSFIKGKERLSTSVAYSRVANITKRSGKLAGYKGFVIELASAQAAKGGERMEPLIFSGFTWANEVRHMIESLAAEHAPSFSRGELEENARIRHKFGLDDASQYVLHEYQCALVHADGSSKGKLYLTQSYLCFSGSLFGRDTRAVYAVSDIIALEKAESPAPNSIHITSASTEERFTFLANRAHAFDALHQLLAINRQDFSLISKRELPTQIAELPPEPFLEKPREPAKPDATLPLALSSKCLVVATCWRYPVRMPLATGCPGTVLIQPPLALHNLLPCALEWRLVPTATGRDARAGATANVSNYGRVKSEEDVTAAPAAASHAPRHGVGTAVLAASELAPEEVIDFHDLPWGTRWGLQLRLPGYDWSGTVIVDVQLPSERTQTVRLRPITAGAKALRVQLRHRASCARSRHLLQVYVSYWLVNGTGLTLQFKRRKQLTVAADDPNNPLESREREASFPTSAERRGYLARSLSAMSTPSSEASSTLEGSVALRPTGWQPPALIGDDLMEEERAPAPTAEDGPEEGTVEGEAAVSADDGEGDDDGGEGGNVDDEADVETGEHLAGDKDTLLYAVPKGGKQGLHCIAVKVVSAQAASLEVGGGSATGDAAASSTSAGWSPPFSLLLGPFSAERAFRAGGYDLAVDIRPAGTAARERTKVVTFVQRFWISNRLGITLEVEQWSSRASGSLEQPMMPLAVGERAPFHWPHPKVKEDAKLLRIRPAPGQGNLGFVPGPDEGWSSGFPIDTAGRFVVHCEQGVQPDADGWWDSLLRVMVSVEPIGATIEIAFTAAPPSPPPYRIDNRTPYIFVARQRGAEQRAHVVQPLTAAPFAWAESSLDHVLLVSLTPMRTDAVGAGGKPATWPPPARQGLQVGWKGSGGGTHDKGGSSGGGGTSGSSGERAAAVDKGAKGEDKVAYAEKQAVRLDEMMKSVPVLVSQGKEREGGASGKHTADGASTTAAAAGGSAWAHVGMQGGVRVLTLSMERVEPPSVAGEDEPHTYLGLSFSGLGVSIVHTGAEELLYLSGQQLTVDFVLSMRTAACEVQLASLQVDNQQASASLHTIISLTARGGGAGGGSAGGSASGAFPEDSPPAAHLSIIKNLRLQGHAVDWWDYVSFRLLEIDVALEPPLLQALLDFALAAQLPALVTMIVDIVPKPPDEEKRERAARRVAKLAARSELLRYGEAQRRWYFGKLELHPVKLNLTFRANNNWGESGSLPIPNIESAPIWLSALVRENLYGTADDLVVAIGKHYLYALLRQVYRVVLRVEMLDAPVGFVRTLGGGVKDLFYLPAKAVVRSPRGLGRGLVAGGASFARGVMLAPVRPAGKMAGALLRTTDRALVATGLSSSGGSTAVTSASSGGKMLKEGAAGLGLGVLRGATGLVYEPLKGARRHGARGFAVGVGKGIAGAALRPTAGVLQLANSWAGAWVLLTHGLTGEGGEGGAGIGGSRVRPPRMLHDNQMRIAPFSMSEALARHVLTSTEEGKYLSEPLLHCDLLLADGQSEAVVAVLTGMRLLTVDSSTWRVQLNLPLRKLQDVSRGDGHVLTLRLKSRKAAAAAAAASTSTSVPAVPPLGLGAIGAGEVRRLACHTEEAETMLHDQLTAALALLNARRRIWTVPQADKGPALPKEVALSAALLTPRLEVLEEDEVEVLEVDVRRDP